MTGCDLQQIAIERRLHGDLGDAEAAALEAHLQTCAACRDYLLAARGAEAAMEEQARAALDGVDWERVRRSAARQRYFWKEDLVTTAAAMLGTVAVTAWLVPARAAPKAVPVMLVAAGLALAFTAARARARIRGVAADADPIELLAAYRSRTRRNLVRWRRQLGLYAVMPPALVLSAAINWPETSSWPFLLATGAVVATLAAYDLLVRLPRVRRELADLEPRG